MSGLCGTEIICYQTKQICIKKITKHFTNFKQKVTGASKKRCQKKRKQIYMAFAYELLYSTITVCARSAATTIAGIAIGEAS